MGLLWTIFAFSVFVAAWLTYREAWVDSRSNRLGMLLRLKRDGERLVSLFDVPIQFAADGRFQMGMEEIYVAEFREGFVKPWLERVRDELAAGELNVFDGDQDLSPVLSNIDIDLFTDMKGLRAYLAERVTRLDDICQGIRHAF